MKYSSISATQSPTYSQIVPYPNSHQLFGAHRHQRSSSAIVLVHTATIWVLGRCQRDCPVCLNVWSERLNHNFGEQLCKRHLYSCFVILYNTSRPGWNLAVYPNVLNLVKQTAMPIFNSLQWLRCAPLSKQNVITVFFCKFHKFGGWRVCAASNCLFSLCFCDVSWVYFVGLLTVTCLVRVSWSWNWTKTVVVGWPAAEHHMLVLN